MQGLNIIGSPKAKHLVAYATMIKTMHFCTGPLLGYAAT